MSALTHCAGCGAELPPPKKSDHRRKWCSERCRKQTLYSTPCVDCGAPTNGSNGNGPNSHERCAHCNGVRMGGISADVWMSRRLEVEQMWADGWTSREIGEAMGISYPEHYVALCRSRGYNLPHRRTPEQVARISVGAAERMAKARAARRPRKVAA